MKNRLAWTGLFSVTVLVVLLVIASYVVPAKAVPAGAPGTWAVGGGGNSSYLVNTTTGEVWTLNGTTKQAVTEVKGTAIK